MFISTFKCIFSEKELLQGNLCVDLVLFERIKRFRNCEKTTYTYSISCFIL